MEENKQEVNGVAHYIEQFYRVQLNLKPKENLDIEEAIKSIKGKIIFRGQANEKWNIVSGAARRLKDENRNWQNEFIRYHVNLIANARSYGYGTIEPGSSLSDLEILAQIQHLGGATCLIDFTTNFLIALWMATTEDKQLNKKDDSTETITNGKLFWIDLGKSVNLSNIVYYNNHTFNGNNENTIQKILAKIRWDFETRPYKVEPCYWLWEPTKLNNRIVKQDSVFLFGLSAFPLECNNDETQTNCDNRIYYKTLTIQQKDKARIRKELELLFGISAESIYYDLSGFALNANNQSLSISHKILPNHNCLYNAKECIKKEQFSLAVSYLEEAIVCKTKDIKEDCKRGKGKECSNNNVGELYFWKAIAHEQRKEFDEASLNFYSAIQKFNISTDCCKPIQNLDLYRLKCESFRRIASISYDKKDYTAAICIEKKLAELYRIHSRELVGYERHNGSDAEFALIELAILTLDKQEFLKRIENVLSIINDFKGIDNNGTILYIVMNEIGNLIFNEKEVDVCNEIDRILAHLEDITKNIINAIKADKGKDNEIRFLGYFLWNLSDLVTFIEKDIINYETTDVDKIQYKRNIIINATKLILIIEKAYDAQNRIKQKVFGSSVASKGY